jgi:oligopeptide/dipeptide ABC transporter ATP-binding protein
VDNLVEVQQITKVFDTGGNFFRREKLYALEDFSMIIKADRPTITAIAGESGSGKTTLARLLLGIIQPTHGNIFYKGKNVGELTSEERRIFRREVQAIFQDPFEVYNPFYKVDHVLTTPIAKFKLAGSRAKTRELMESSLRSVGLLPEETLGRYPHQLSGGQRQRIMVARSLLLHPRLILADEPVSMVDASLRATILKSLLDLNKKHGISLVYITHDLTTAYQLCEKIVVLYRGSTVEVGNIDQVIKSPKHPYTQLLVGSIPLPDPESRWTPIVEEEVKPVPATISDRQGCKFANRCPHLMDICHTAHPPLYHTADGQAAACYLYQDAPVVNATEVMGKSG